MLIDIDKAIAAASQIPLQVTISGKTFDLKMPTDEAMVGFAAFVKSPTNGPGSEAGIIKFIAPLLPAGIDPKQLDTVQMLALLRTAIAAKVESRKSFFTKLADSIDAAFREGDGPSLPRTSNAATASKAAG